MNADLDEPRRRAVGRILALAQQFASRSRHDQAALIQEFQDAVREHVARLGPVTIDDDDDEQLVLDADGRFRGRVLVDSDGASRWDAIATPLDVIDHYDPVDLFADLSDAIGEQLTDAGATGGSGDLVGGLAAADEPPAAPGPLDEEGESPSRRILRDLHDAGVYSDADYAAKLAELDPPSGS